MNILTFGSRDEWLAGRRAGIGGSDAAAIMHVSKWATPQDVWAQKVGLTSVSSGQMSPAAEVGVAIEPGLREVIGRRTGWVIRHSENQVIVNPDHGFIRMSPDGIIEKADGFEGPGVLQIKTVDSAHRSDWSEEPPLEYMIQVQHELMATQAGWAVLAAFFGGNDLRHFVVRPHEAFQKRLLVEEVEFWRHVESEKMPAPKDDRELVAASKLLLRVEEDKTVDLPREALEWHEERMRLLEQKRAGEAAGKKLEHLKARFVMALGDAHHGIIDGTDIRYSASLVKKDSYTVKPSQYRLLKGSHDKKEKSDD